MSSAGNKLLIHPKQHPDEYLPMQLSGNVFVAGMATYPDAGLKLNLEDSAGVSLTSADESFRSSSQHRRASLGGHWGLT